MSRRRQAIAPEKDSSAYTAVCGFSAEQLQKLDQPLDKNHIHARELGGRQLSYIEGWYAVTQANEIFGYGGWDRETVHFERVYERTRGDGAVCGYLARVRIKVRAGDSIISREGSGWGWAQESNVGAAHEKALKTAETDATKRALSTFGPQFGLSLYDKEQNGAADRPKPTLTLLAPDGKSLSENLSPEAYCSGLRQLIHACRTIPELDDLARYNAVPLAELSRLAPFLRNADGVHFADLLQRLMERAKRRLNEALPGTTDMAGGAKANAIQADTEVRTIPAPEGEFKHAAVHPAVLSAPADDSRLNEAPANSIHSHGRDGGLNGVTATSHQRAGASSFSFGIQRVKDEIAGGAPSSVFSDEALPSIALPQPDKSSQAPRTEAAAISLAPSNIAPGPRIDKSVLVIASERRIRDKTYLKQIRDLPCTICGRQPSHTHHLRFAQGRGLSQKVSDEYVVPLCGLHHSDLHRTSDEPSWWKTQKIDPVPIAAELWGRYQGNPA